MSDNQPTGEVLPMRKLGDTVATEDFAAPTSPSKHGFLEPAAGHREPNSAPPSGASVRGFLTPG